MIDQSIETFRYLVTESQSYLHTEMPADVQRRLGYEAGALVHRISAHLFGYDKLTFDVMDIDRFLQHLSKLRGPVYARLKDAGIQYYVYASNNRIYAELKDLTSGTSVSAPLSPAFDEDIAQKVYLLDWTLSYSVH